MKPGPGWVEIDIEAITSNLRTVRAQIGPDVALCAVVKADAYGHGIEFVLPAVMREGVAIIGITTNDEARQAREAGFAGRIIRLRAALDDEIADAIADDVEEWVGGIEHARVVDSVARAVHRTIRCHVSINSTGLSRDGAEPDDLAAITAIARHERLQTVGVASHFPREDAADVIYGAMVFDRESQVAARMLHRAGSPPLSRHCASTHAALSVPASRFDMVRIGAALYGDSPMLGDALQPAMRVVSRIAAVNAYPAGRTVGYERTHRLHAASRLAVVPIGYADGYRRAFGGTADVLVCGQRAPVIDLLAMNACIIDITHIPTAMIGDEVVLFGRQGGERITSAETERASGHIAADSYTAWGRLLARTIAVPSSVSPGHA